MARLSFKSRTLSLFESLCYLTSLDSGGEHHSIFLFSDGSVSGCGRNDSSQIGLGDDHELVVAAKKAHSEGKAALDAMLVQVQAEIAELRKKGEGEYEDMSDEDAAVKAGEIAGSRVDVPQPLINTPASIKFPDEGADPDRGLEAGPAKIVQIAAGTRSVAVDAQNHRADLGRQKQPRHFG